MPVPGEPLALSATMTSVRRSQACRSRRCARTRDARPRCAAQRRRDISQGDVVCGPCASPRNAAGRLTPGGIPLPLSPCKSRAPHDACPRTLSNAGTTCDTVTSTTARGSARGDTPPPHPMGTDVGLPSSCPVPSLPGDVTEHHTGRHIPAGMSRGLSTPRDLMRRACHQGSRWSGPGAVGCPTSRGSRESREDCHEVWSAAATHSPTATSPTPDGASPSFRPLCRLWRSGQPRPQGSRCSAPGACCFYTTTRTQRPDRRQSAWHSARPDA